MVIVTTLKGAVTLSLDFLLYQSEKLGSAGVTNKPMILVA